jgi:hypothetical protein
MSNNYINIDFNKVKGYKALSPQSRQLFERIYKLHNTIQGLDYKMDYIPLAVKQDGDKLKVTFKTCWLYYYANGTWG